MAVYSRWNIALRETTKSFSSLLSCSAFWKPMGSEFHTTVVIFHETQVLKLFMLLYFCKFIIKYYLLLLVFSYFFLLEVLCAAITSVQMLEWAFVTSFPDCVVLNTSESCRIWTFSFNLSASCNLSVMTL